MKGLTIVCPIPANFFAEGSGVSNLASPSPREIWIADSSGAHTIDVDLTSVKEVDCFFLGGTNARADATWSVQSIAGIGGAVTDTHIDAEPMRLAGSIRSRYCAVGRLAEPVAGRFFRITVDQPVSPMEIGVAFAALALEWPYAFGSGRLPIDTSRVVALDDGGFGVDAGVVKSLFQWRFLDLDDVTLDKLWAIAEDRGESKPLVVIEGPAWPPAATAVHYGLFRRFEAFEREDPASTKWSLTVEEWR